MKCANCGNELEPKTIYCKKCGQAIQMVPEYNVLEEELLSQVLEEKPIDDVIDNKDNQSSSESAKVNGTLILSLGILAAIGIVILVVYLFRVNGYDYQFDVGENLVEEEQYEAAIEHFEKALVSDTTAEAYAAIALCYYSLGDYDSSIIYAKKAIVLDELNEDAYRYLIYSYVALGEDKKVSELMNGTDNLLVYQLISGIIIDAPQFNPISGSYGDDVELKLSSSSDYDIYYTLDGTDPMRNGELYKKPIIITEGTTTVTAICVSEDDKYGLVGSATYSVKYNNPGYPVVSPSSGTYGEGTKITISALSDGAQIFYTWDGTDPTVDSAEYFEPIDIPYGNNILSVIVIDKHGLTSDILRCNYIWE